MSRMTYDDLQRLLRRNPSVTAEGLVAPRPRLPDPKPEHNETKPLGKTVPGEKESLPSITVRFRGFRVRPLDPDNFAGSVKDLLDGLRHMGAIQGDEPWRIKLETDQQKVRSYKEEKTEITILT